MNRIASLTFVDAYQAGPVSVRVKRSILCRECHPLAILIREFPARVVEAAVWVRSDVRSGASRGRLSGKC